MTEWADEGWVPWVAWGFGRWRTAQVECRRSVVWLLYDVAILWYGMVIVWWYGMVTIWYGVMVQMGWQWHAGGVTAHFSWPSLSICKTGWNIWECIRVHEPPRFLSISPQLIINLPCIFMKVTYLSSSWLPLSELHYWIRCLNMCHHCC